MADGAAARRPPRPDAAASASFLRLNPDAVGSVRRGHRPLPRHRPVPRRPDDHRDRLDHAERLRRPAALGPLPVHPAQPGLLHPGRLRRAADPAGAEPAGRPRPRAGRGGPRPGRRRPAPTPSTWPASWPSLRVAVGELATRDFIRSELTRLVEGGDDGEKREKKAKKKREQRSTRLGDRREPRDTADRRPRARTPSPDRGRVRVRPRRRSARCSTSAVPCPSACEVDGAPASCCRSGTPAGRRSATATAPPVPAGCSRRGPASWTWRHRQPVDRAGAGRLGVDHRAAGSVVVHGAATVVATSARGRPRWTLSSRPGPRRVRAGPSRRAGCPRPAVRWRTSGVHCGPPARTVDLDATGRAVRSHRGTARRRRPDRPTDASRRCGGACSATRRPSTVTAARPAPRGRRPPSGFRPRRVRDDTDCHRRPGRRRRREPYDGQRDAASARLPAARHRVAGPSMMSSATYGATAARAASGPRSARRRHRRAAAPGELGVPTAAASADDRGGPRQAVPAAGSGEPRRRACPRRGRPRLVLTGDARSPAPVHRAAPLEDAADDRPRAPGHRREVVTHRRSDDRAERSRHGAQPVRTCTSAPAAPASTRTTMNGARSASATAATASPASRPSTTRSLAAGERLHRDERGQQRGRHEVDDPGHPRLLHPGGRHRQPGQLEQVAAQRRRRAPPPRAPSRSCRHLRRPRPAGERDRDDGGDHLDAGAARTGSAPARRPRRRARPAAGRPPPGSPAAAAATAARGTPRGRRRRARPAPAPPRAAAPSAPTHRGGVPDRGRSRRRRRGRPAGPAPGRGRRWTAPSSRR